MGCTQPAEFSKSCSMERKCQKHGIHCSSPKRIDWSGSFAVNSAEVDILCPDQYNGMLPYWYNHDNICISYMISVHRLYVCRKQILYQVFKNVSPIQLSVAFCWTIGAFYSAILSFNKNKWPSFSWTTYPNTINKFNYNLFFFTPPKSKSQAKNHIGYPTEGAHPPQCQPFPSNLRPNSGGGGGIWRGWAP